MPDLLVTGPSGHVGGEVVRCLTAAGVSFRRAERSAGTIHPPAGSLVDTVRFDFTQPSTWPAAYDGIHTMFVVRPPAISNVRRDLLPALAAARDAGVQHIVFLSLQGADTNRIVPHHTVEAWLRSSGMAWTFLRPSFFHQNLSTTHAADIRDHNQIIVPAGTGATAFVDATDVGAVAAAAILDPSAHRNRAWTITGSRAFTYVQVADILTAELGRRIRYTQPGLLRYTYHARDSLQMPWGMAAVTAAIYTTARLGRAAGLSHDVRTVLGRDPIDFTEFAHREHQVWIS